jgi:hypothetical protein
MSERTDAESARYRAEAPTVTYGTGRWSEATAMFSAELRIDTEIERLQAQGREAAAAHRAACPECAKGTL